MTTPKYTHIVSLGYRCSSAGILKSLGLKQASYPFDWLVSRLPIIEHCIATGFVEFMNPQNYSHKSSTTNNYTTLDPDSAKWVCDESICVSGYYETAFDPININFYLARPLTPAKDAYAYRLMMNHHDITRPQDYDYYSRCVERWNRIFRSDPHRRAPSSPTPNPKTTPITTTTTKNRILTLYIHPAIFKECYDQSKYHIREDICRFHRSLSASVINAVEGSKHDGIYIIPVKTPYEYPTHHCAKYVLEEQADDPATPNCRICILWANRDFIDAGEIFMGNSYVETYVIKDYVSVVSKNGLPPPPTPTSQMREDC